MNANQRDARLDRLLEALGAAQADAGFERRVLHGVGLRSKGVRPKRSAWAWTPSAACALGIGLALLEVAHRAESPRVQVAAQVPARVTSRIVKSKATPASSSGRRMPDVERVRLPRAPVETAAVRNVPPSGREAFISFPAPPLPLTEQERLLLRIVHKGDPVEMAMLDPAVQARLDAADVADYKEFFKPPPPQPTAEELVKALEAKEKGEEQ